MIISSGEIEGIGNGCLRAGAVELLVKNGLAAEGIVADDRDLTQDLAELGIVAAYVILSELKPGRAARHAHLPAGQSDRRGKRRGSQRRETRD